MIYVLTLQEGGRETILGVSDSLDECTQAAEEFYSYEKQRMLRYQQRWGDLLSDDEYEALNVRNSRPRWGWYKEQNSYICSIPGDELTLRIQSFVVGDFSSGDYW